MKKIIKLFGLLAAVFLSFVACEEDGLLEYDQENNVYFPNQCYEYYQTRTTLTWDDGNKYTAPEVKYDKANAAQDTLNYSAISGNIVVISVRLMGQISKERRQIACRAIPKNNPGVAKEGVNFEILDAFIPANSREGGILVRLNTEEMTEEDVYTIEFELLPNENFNTNYSAVPNKENSKDMVSATRITLLYSATLLKPTYWDSGFKPALGDWSVKKVFILANNFNFDTSGDFLYASYPPSIMMLIPYGVLLRTWLEDYEKENGAPCYENDNTTKMKVGNIIYSLY